MLNRLRARLDSYFASLGSTATRLGISPTAWTAVGLLFSLAAGASFSLGGRTGSAVGGLLILVSGFFDILDGAVARAARRETKRGAFLDSTLDRVAEVAIYAGIVAGGLADGLLSLLALSFSLLVSYTRARAESLGVGLSGVGIGERGERLLILSAASLAGFVSYGVILVAVVAAYTFAERVYRASARLSVPPQLP
jgi:archaetidylinositol phosphate synthase